MCASDITLPRKVLVSLSRLVPTAVTAILVSVLPASAQHPWSGLPAEVQIRLAVQAAPEDMREDATVQGYDASGGLGLLREGSNKLVCLAPNPASATARAQPGAPGRS